MNTAVAHTLEAALREFTQKHAISIPEQQWEFIQEGQQHEIEDGLYQIFEGYGIEGMGETGTSAEEYMPSIILGSLELLDCHEWALQELSSDNAWMTANVVLAHENGTEHQFTIDDVNDSDWVAFDVFTKLNRFAKQYSENALVTFCSDDPFRVISLPHAIAAELKTIIDEFAEPY